MLLYSLDVLLARSACLFTTGTAIMGRAGEPSAFVIGVASSRASSCERMSRCAFAKRGTCSRLVEREWGQQGARRRDRACVLEIDTVGNREQDEASDGDLLTNPLSLPPSIDGEGEVRQAGLGQPRANP